MLVRRWCALALALAACAEVTPPEEGKKLSSSGLDGSIVVNGNTLSERQAEWVRFVASDVVPNLAGSADENLDVGARVAWWSLKEGVFDLENPLAYSNCNDVHVGAFDPCAQGVAWQVGLSGVQVPGRSVTELEAVAARVHPGVSIDDVLRGAARQAGVSEDSAAATAGSLRASWLLRDSAIGFTVQDPIIYAECIEGSYGWCYGTGWPSTAAYAPSRSAALAAIEDLRSALASLAGSKQSSTRGGETCGDRAKRLQWNRAYCEQASSSSAFTRTACNGTGTKSSDCSRCCDADTVGPSHTDESCGVYAERMGFTAARCESSTNSACGGSGPSTGDGCVHCCGG